MLNIVKNQHQSSDEDYCTDSEIENYQQNTTLVKTNKENLQVS